LLLKKYIQENTAMLDEKASLTTSLRTVTMAKDRLEASGKGQQDLMEIKN